MKTLQLIKLLLFGKLSTFINIMIDRLDELTYENHMLSWEINNMQLYYNIGRTQVFNEMNRDFERYNIDQLQYKLEF